MYLRQELARGLGELLSYEGNVEEDFDLTFQVRKHFIIQIQDRNKKNTRGKCFTIMANSLLWPFPSDLFFLPILFHIYSPLLLLTLSVHHSRLLSSLLIIFALSQHLWTASPKQICCGSVVSVNLCPSGFQLIKLFKVAVNLKSNFPQCYFF